MAQVFEGHHPHLGRKVALKVMQPTIAAHPMAVARFLREAKTASQVRHQNIVEVFDMGTESGIPFIVMEFLEGSNLATLLGQRGALPLTAVVDVFLPILSAVASAHRAGVVHRDLKPGNVMITRREPMGIHPVVLDFGISKSMSEDLEGTLTRSSSLLGTVQYMAPELTKGAKFASPASDQYALGVMMYECATGRRPFAGESYYEVMHAIVTAPVTPPSRIQPSLPPDFDAVVQRAMNRDPDQRFPSVEALGSAVWSFGRKATRTLWEREFTGSLDGDDDLWTSNPKTLDDVESPKPAPMPSGRRWATWTFPSLAVYAALTTILLARYCTTKEPSPTVTSLPVGTTVSAVGPSPTQLDEPNAGGDVSPQPTVAAVVSSPAPIALRPRRPPGTPASSSASPARPNAPAHSASPLAPSEVLGTNESPIVE
jgi:serine/threonine-protein kinase